MLENAGKRVFEKMFIKRIVFNWKIIEGRGV